MSKSRAVLFVLLAVVLGFAGGLMSHGDMFRDVTGTQKYREVEGLFYETNQRLLQVQKENGNLREQVKILEQMVATQQAQLDEIKAVIEVPRGEQ